MTGARQGCSSPSCSTHPGRTGTGQDAAGLPEAGRELATRARASCSHRPGDRGNEEQGQWPTATVTATAAATGYQQQRMMLARSTPTRYISGLKAKGRSTAPSHREAGLRITDPCPRDVPELPSTANDRHQQPPANMKLERDLNLRATHENTLVMRSSLGDDEDQGAGGRTVVGDLNRCVPAACDRSVKRGQSRSLGDTRPYCLTCARAGQRRRIRHRCPCPTLVLEKGTLSA